MYDVVAQVLIDARTRSHYVLPIVLAIASGCVTPPTIDNDMSLIKPISLGWDELDIAVGVLPFDASQVGKDKSRDRKLAEMAGNYLPVRLAKTLNRSEYISNAYVVVEPTPAVDFMVRGVLDKMNGERIGVTLTVTRSDGLEVLSRRYYRDMDSERFATLHHPYDVLWTEFVNDVAKEAIIPLANPNVYAEHRRARLAAYSPRTDIDRCVLIPKAWRVIATGSRAEREKFLDVGSSAREMAAAEVSDEWREWSRQTISINERQRSRQRKQAVAAVSVVLMLAGGVANASQAAQAGYEPNMDGLTQSVMLIGEAMEENAEALAALKEAGMQLDWSVVDVSQPLIVRLGEEEVRLVGTYEEKLGMLRSYVADRATALLEPLPGGALASL